MAESDIGEADIRCRLLLLTQSWEELKRMSSER